jgi:hypothetical protein
MDTARPATTNPKPDKDAGYRRAKDLTFVLGPPEGREAVDQIAEAAARVGVTPEALWIEMVRGSVRELLEPDSDGRSRLDEIFSAALGERVTVWGVSGAEHFQCNRRLPGLIVETASILDSAGRPVDRDFADRQLRGSITRALMDLTHADWATCTAAFDADELGFPNLGPTGKEA